MMKGQGTTTKQRSVMSDDQWQCRVAANTHMWSDPNEWTWTELLMNLTHETWIRWDWDLPKHGSIKSSFFKFLMGYSCELLNESWTRGQPWWWIQNIESLCCINIKSTSAWQQMKRIIDYLLWTMQQLLQESIIFTSNSCLAADRNCYWCFIVYDAAAARGYVKELFTPNSCLVFYGQCSSKRILYSPQTAVWQQIEIVIGFLLCMMQQLRGNM